MLCGKHPAAAWAPAARRQPRAVAFGERNLLARHQLAFQQLRQNVPQRIGGDQVAGKLPAHHQRQAGLHHFYADAFNHRHKIAVGVSRRILVAGIGADLLDLALRLRTPQARKHRRAKWRFGLCLDALRLQLRVSPLQPNQHPAVAQQLVCIGLPGCRGGVVELQGLKILHSARKAGADIRHGRLNIPLQLVLQLAGLKARG